MAVRLRGALAPGVDAAPEVRFAGPWVEAQTLNPKDGTLLETWWENHGKNMEKWWGNGMETGIYMDLPY